MCKCCATSRSVPNTTEILYPTHIVHTRIIFTSWSDQLGWQSILILVKEFHYSAALKSISSKYLMGCSRFDAVIFKSLPLGHEGRLQRDTGRIKMKGEKLMTMGRGGFNKQGSHRFWCSVVG